MYTPVRSTFIAFCLAACTGVLAAPAEATPPTGVTGSTLYERTDGDTTYTLRVILVAPGGSTGWHYHDGPARASVVQGTLTHLNSDCAVDGVYGPGSEISEMPGADHVHLARNLGSTPVILFAWYATPVGHPLANSVAAPACDAT